MTKKSSFLPAITVFTVIFLALFAAYTYLLPRLLDEKYPPEQITLAEPGQVSGGYYDTSGVSQKTEQESLPSVPVSQPKEPPQSRKININTASEEELCKIIGVGPVTAKKIIEYRNLNGYFSTTEEICLVSGIGKVKFEKMKESICID